MRAPRAGTVAAAAAAAASRASHGLASATPRQRRAAPQTAAVGESTMHTGFSATDGLQHNTIPMEQLRDMVGDIVREILPAISVPTTSSIPTSTTAPAPAHPPVLGLPDDPDMDASAPAAAPELFEGLDMVAPAAPDLELPYGPGMAAPIFAADGEHAVPVSAALRLRIVEDKYVDLGLLLEPSSQVYNNPAATFELVNGLLRPATRAQRTIQTFGGWSLAFLRFTGIYLSAHPNAAAGLLAHMRQVSQLTASGLGLAWREFDEAFRRARELAPGLHPWGGMTASSAIWLQAVARGVGGAAKSRSAAPQPTVRRPFRICFSFNRPGGCTTRQCRFQHRCAACQGPHPASRCPRRPARLPRVLPSNATTTTPKVR